MQFLSRKDALVMISQNNFVFSINFVTANRHKKEGSKTGKEIFLGDLRAVAEAKVPAKKPADVEKIIRFLEEAL
jgi:hypothetical protein